MTWRRALAGALALALFAVAVAAGLGWTRRIAIAEWWITQRAHALGLEAVALRVVSVERHGIAIESIAIGTAQPPDLAIERLDADWSWRSLRAGRLDALRVKGVALRGRFDDAGPSLGALDPLWKRESPATGTLELPAPVIALDGARVHVATPRGPATGTFGGALSENEKGIDGKFELDVGGAGLTARGRLTLGGSLAEPSFRLRLDPLRAGALVLRLDTRGTAPRGDPFVLGETTLGIAGGTVRIEGVKLDLAAKRSAAPLLVDDIDLAALLKLAAVDGLAGTGRIEGTLPLVRAGGKLRIEDGLLRASGDGTIQYAPSESVRKLATSRPQDLGVAIEAFSDFRYELLEARVDGELTGALVIGLSVRGANPSFENGRAVSLDLNLDAHLADLVRAGAESYRVPEQIEERVRERSGGAK